MPDQRHDHFLAYALKRFNALNVVTLRSVTMMIYCTYILPRSNAMPQHMLAIETFHDRSLYVSFKD